MSIGLGLVGATLSLGTPLVIAAVGETVSERAGVLNIGLEGVMLSSAFAGFYFSHTTGNPWLGVCSGVAAAILLALITAYLVLKIGADQVVVGTGVNLFSLGLTGSLFVSLFGQTGKLATVPTVPKTADALSLNSLMLVAVVCVVFAWFLLMRTRWGLAARAAGEAPTAAESAGYSVLRLRFQAMMFSAVTAGLAGAYLSLAQTNSFAENMTEGRGFVVIAAVTFGRWTSIGSALACLLIAFAYGLKYLVISISLGIPSQLFDALPYLLALAVLAGAGRGASAPAALATPYRRA
ncbi:MAG: ABC transporter permease [Armatimonadetes bacterium]|nr:ABC transporter permease [Armatimonadota bacterium]